MTPILVGMSILTLLVWLLGLWLFSIEQDLKRLEMEAANEWLEERDPADWWKEQK